MRLKTGSVAFGSSGESLSNMFSKILNISPGFSLLPIMVCVFPALVIPKASRQQSNPMRTWSTCVRV